jgi:hypothetical protein
MTTDRPGEPKSEPRTEEREPRERTVAPPIEREHETQAGAAEQEEQRKRERERSRRDPDRT